MAKQRKGAFLVKQVKFNDSDKPLIFQITEYQKAHGLGSFIGALRQLCKVALEMEKITH